MMRENDLAGLLRLRVYLDGKLVCGDSKKVFSGRGEIAAATRLAAV
jgi:hypothetical protein